MGPGLIKKSSNPVLYGISCSYQKLRLSHDSNNSNFVNPFVLNNPIFFRGPRNKDPLNLSYLELPESGNSALAFLTARDFFNFNGVKTLMELELDYNLTLSLYGYADLVRCLNHYV